MNEPEGTRIQVVKGFSELSFNFVAPNLPNPIERHELGIHWPKWRHDHWICFYSLDECPVCRFLIWHDNIHGYSAVMRLFDTDMTPLNVYTDQTPPVETPYEVFQKIPETFGDQLIPHLTEITKK